MRDTLKVFRIEENEIIYTFYNVSRKNFYFIEFENAIAFQKDDAKMFVLKREASSRLDFESLMNDLFACDEIKVLAR